MRNMSSDYDIQKENVYNEFLDAENKSYMIKRKKKSKISAIISFVLSLFPLLLILYCYIVSGGSGDESGAGAIWWLVAIYYWTAGLPIAFVAIICGIISFKSFKNKLAIISIIITLLPFIYFFITIVASSITNAEHIITTIPE